MKFVQAKTEKLVTADFAVNSKWEQKDPSVFEMQRTGWLQGEFQVANGYGPERAPQVMRVDTCFFLIPSLFCLDL